MKAIRSIPAFLGALAVGLSVCGASLAQDQGGYPQPHHHHHHHHRSYDNRCAAERRHAANTGTVIGAIGGGLVGNAMSHGGGRLGGTVIGAGVGAVAGHEIGKHGRRC